MRKSFGNKGWLVPEPVLIIATKDENGNVDAMNAAWGGMYDYDSIILCLSEGHKTTHNILNNKQFTVSFGTEDQMEACDYVGLVSANKVPDKIRNTGWTVEQAEKVDAPYFKELPLTLECELTGQTEDGNLIAKIVNVTCDEALLDKDGNPDLKKMKLISFDPIAGEYLVVERKAGKAFSDGKKLMK